LNYWPGFVDALSTLILSIIFLLSIFSAMRRAVRWRIPIWQHLLGISRQHPNRYPSRWRFGYANCFAKAADWATPAHVKRDIRSVSILKAGRAVFNLAGNKYRIVVWINYPYRVVYIRFIGTHRQYDLIDAQKI
jgi:mRNA interferase HigB